MCLVKCKIPMSGLSPFSAVLDYPEVCTNIEEHREEYEGNHGYTSIDYWVTCRYFPGKRFSQVCREVEQYFCPYTSKLECLKFKGAK